MTQRVLVTGTAGFIGSHLSEALIGRGYEVAGVDNFDPFYARDVKERNLAGLLTWPRNPASVHRSRIRRRTWKRT